MNEMAYDRNRIMIFGGAGIAIAALLIIFFIPVKTETHVGTSVSLQEIPGYGFQTMKISEGQADVTHLNLTLGGFEIRGAEGEWTGISVPGTVSFNLLRDPETTITADADGLEPGSYTAVRFQVLGGIEYTNATLTNGEVVPVDVPYFKVEYSTEEFEIGEGTEGLSLVLRRGSGQLANYMLPDYHISTGTMKIEVEATPF
jgi:hypothetical protein